MVNKYVGRSKLSDVNKAAKNGILVPESRLTLRIADNLKEWIEKKIYSSQGKGIIEARGRKRIIGKYYQRLVTNRRFELRVHAFLWVPTDEWKIHKRLGPADQIAWNFHQGGYFQTVTSPNKHEVFRKAKDISKKLLGIYGAAFGAVDFIVDSDLNVLFIEINSSPGFSNLSDYIYFSAMKDLSEMPKKNVIKYGV